MIKRRSGYYINLLVEKNSTSIVSSRFLPLSQPQMPSRKQVEGFASACDKQCMPNVIKAHFPPRTQFDHRGSLSHVRPE